MKGLFPQYNDVSTVNYSDTWKNALFVFDTNVLLNLYRYQTNTREELITVLGQLSDRIWLPHHVALEFQRNRLHVIADQSKRFFEIQDVIEKSKSSLSNDIDKLQLHKRHALINPDSLVSGFKELADKFLEELKKLQESQQQLTSIDPLKQKIEELFDGKVGTSFASQKEIDELFKTAENRYKFKIPPGYEDSKKDKHSIDEFAHQGIIYKRKYGDYLVWRQILDHIKNSEIKQIIFITDDGKEDWWRKIDLQGPKTIGPRPELIEEAYEVGAETFLMYKPEGFLTFAQKFLRADISEETLTEVREVSSSKHPTPPAAIYKNMAASVMNWIARRTDQIQESTSYPDVIGTLNGERHGFEIKSYPATIPKSVLINAVSQAAHGIIREELASLTLIFVAENNEGASIIFDRLNEITFPDDPINIAIGVCGFLDSRPMFFAHYEISSDPKLQS
ncbi:PIN-like domain-containing protein [Pseudomonas prosekii]|uniref:PIN-like domain-containing protein n=1 Tax=Pseudomonas prosekii TaxID=1148509 RepID=UPI003F755829